MKRIILLSALFVASCSSPPEPPKVDWKGNAEVMNRQLTGKPHKALLKVTR